MLEKNLDLTRHPCTNTQALTIQSAHRSPSHNRICKIWNIKWKKKRFPTLLSILLSFSIYPSSRRLVNSMKKKKKISNIDRTLSQPFFFFFFLGLIFSLGPYFHEKFPTESLVGDGDSTLFFSFFVRYWLCNGG